MTANSSKYHSLDLEAKASHAVLVLLDGGLTLLLGIFGLRKQHAVIADLLLVFANAAWLE